MRYEILMMVVCLSAAACGTQEELKYSAKAAEKLTERVSKLEESKEKQLEFNDGVLAVDRNYQSSIQRLDNERKEEARLRKDEDDAMDRRLQEMQARLPSPPNRKEELPAAPPPSAPIPSPEPVQPPAPRGVYPRSNNPLPPVLGDLEPIIDWKRYGIESIPASKQGAPVQVKVVDRAENNTLYCWSWYEDGRPTTLSKFVLRRGGRSCEECWEWVLIDPATVPRGFPPPPFGQYGGGQRKMVNVH